MHIRKFLHIILPTMSAVGKKENYLRQSTSFVIFYYWSLLIDTNNNAFKKAEALIKNFF